MLQRTLSTLLRTLHVLLPLEHPQGLDRVFQSVRDVDPAVHHLLPARQNDSVYLGLANQTDRNTQRSRVSALRYKLDVQFMPCSVHY